MAVKKQGLHNKNLINGVEIIEPNIRVGFFKRIARILARMNDTQKLKQKSQLNNLDNN